MKFHHHTKHPDAPGAIVLLACTHSYSNQRYVYIPACRSFHDKTPVWLTPGGVDVCDYGFTPVAWTELPEYSTPPSPIQELEKYVDDLELVLSPVTRGELMRLVNKLKDTQK